MNETHTPPDVGLDIGLDVVLSPEVQALLAIERTQRDRMPEASHARVWERVAATVAPPLPRIRRVGVAKALSTLAIGGALGAGGHAFLTRQHAQAPVGPVQAHVEPVVPKAITPPLVVEPSEAPDPAAVHMVHAHRPTPPAAVAVSPPPAQAMPTPETSDRALVAERTLIDMARTALTRGESERALEAIDRHAREFPSGTLAEEREALKVQVFLAQHDSERARAAVDTFARRFPGSLLLPALRASLQREVDDEATP